MEFSHLRDALAEYGEQLRAAYRQNLASNHHPTREDTLRTTAEWKVDIDGTDYLLSLNLEEYWKNVEEDMPAHWPPTEAILRWVMVKPVIPRPDDKGRIPTPKQLTFLIKRAIAGESPNQKKLKNPHGGTKGTHDLQNARDTLEQQALDAIGEAVRMYAEAPFNTIMSYRVPTDEQMDTFLAVFRHKSEY